MLIFCRKDPACERIVVIETNPFFAGKTSGECPVIELSSKGENLIHINQYTTL